MVHAPSSTVKKLTLDLSSYAGGGGPGRRMSKSPEHIQQKVTLFDKKQLVSNAAIDRDEEDGDVDEGDNSVNIVTQPRDQET